jgi:hypothetical protein
VEALNLCKEEGRHLLRSIASLKGELQGKSEWVNPCLARNRGDLSAILRIVDCRWGDCVREEMRDAW